MDNRDRDTQKKAVKEKKAEWYLKRIKRDIETTSFGVGKSEGVFITVTAYGNNKVKCCIPNEVYRQWTLIQQALQEKEKEEGSLSCVQTLKIIMEESADFADFFKNDNDEKKKRPSQGTLKYYQLTSSFEKLNAVFDPSAEFQLQSLPTTESVPKESQNDFFNLLYEITGNVGYWKKCTSGHDKPTGIGKVCDVIEKDRNSPIAFREKIDICIKELGIRTEKNRWLFSDIKDSLLRSDEAKHAYDAISKALTEAKKDTKTDIENALSILSELNEKMKNEQNIERTTRITPNDLGGGDNL